jgi:CDP-diacylglycerol--glycerol-3-phosphate 3-phosphatidyltransferase
MNSAHCFTLLRILISPIFPLLYLGYEWLKVPLFWVPYILLGLLLICECSDILDGFLARRCNQVTDLGKVLDPMADTVTHISFFLTFTQGLVQLPLLLVLIFLYREFFVSTLRTLCALRGFALAARFSGKLKAVLQAFAAFLVLFLMLLHLHGVISLDALQRSSFMIVAVVAFYTMFSACDYFYANRHFIKRSLYNM